MSETIRSDGAIHEEINVLLNKVHDLWKIMYDEKKICLREQQFMGYLKGLFEDILAGQQELLSNMEREIERKKREFTQIQKDLGISAIEHLPCSVEGPYSVVLNEIENKIKKFEDMRDERLAQLEKLRNKERSLCHLLEIAPLPDFENRIPDAQQLEELESHIFRLQEEKICRTDIFNDSKMKIIELMEKLECEVEGEFEIHVLSSNENTFIPSTSNMTKLKDLKTSLENEYEDKVTYRKSLIDLLTKLWDRIKIENNEREAFLLKHPSVKTSDIEALKHEVERCEEIKKENIKPIVEQIRGQIKDMWDLLTYTDEQRKEFKAYWTDHFSEDVLDLHEIEIDSLHAYYEKYKSLFELIEKRNVLWDRMIHLDLLSQDKTRLFNNRGGQLLKEEKERKSLEVQLPRVDHQLKTSLEEFHKAEGRPFLWYGQPLLDQITRQWEERKADKENRKLARKVENKKQLESEAMLGSRAAVSKRKMGTPLANISEAKMRRRDDQCHTPLLQGGARTPGGGRLHTPLNISTASIASYSHFQDGLERTPRSALRTRGNKAGVGHSSPTLVTPVGRKGTPASVARTLPRSTRSRNTPSTIPRITAHRTRLQLDF